MSDCEIWTIVLNGVAALAGAAAAWAAIKAYMSSKQELAVVLQPKVRAILEGIIVRYPYIADGRPGDLRDLEISTLVSNTGPVPVEVQLRITLLLPDGKKHVAKGWYSGEVRPLWIEEGFKGVLRWSENFPEVDLNTHYQSWWNAGADPSSALAEIRFQVDLTYWPEDEPKQRKTPPTRTYLLRLGTERLEFVP